VEEGPIRPLYITGGALLLGGYVGGLITGFTALDRSGAYAAIPIAGPFVAGATYKSPCQSSQNGGLCWDWVPYQGIFYVFGAIQAAGAVLAVTGATVHRKRLVRDAAVTFVPVPLATRNAVGLALAGAF
jgi:hypothetical protein